MVVLYRFELNEDRVDFKFNDPGLKDRVVDNNKELDSVIFGEGFSGITDIKTGPDGLLYVLSFEDGTITELVSEISKILVLEKDLWWSNRHSYFFHRINRYQFEKFLFFVRQLWHLVSFFHFPISCLF